MRKLEREKSVSLQSKDEAQGLLLGALLFRRSSQSRHYLPSRFTGESGLLKKKTPLGPSGTVGGSTDWHSHSGVSLKNQKKIQSYR